MNEETIKISNVIKKPPELRSKPELDEILPYLAKRSELLQNLQRGILFELIKYCQHKQYMKDDVIIKQGTVGDCFYIILTGHTSVYIDTCKSDDNEDQELTTAETVPVLDDILGTKKQVKQKTISQALDRSSLGKFIMYIDSGKSFGEVALLSENTERNASIVADMDNMDLLVVDIELYNRTVKERQLAEYRDKRNFINSDPIFSNWINKFKRLLEMSLVKQTFSFDNIIVKQGDPVDGLYFIIDGQAKIVVDPIAHSHQFPKLMKEEQPGKRRQLAQSHIDVRRRLGYAESEKRLNHRLVELAFLKSGDAFGLLELSANLETSLGSLVCTSAVTVLQINSKNYDRLIMKKNARTHDLLVSMTHDRISDMLMTKAGANVPLFQHIYEKYIFIHEAQEEQTKTKPDKDDKEFLHQQLIRLYKEGKMALVEPCVPDSVYFKYKSIESRSRALSAREKMLKKQRDNSINNKLRTLAETRRRAMAGNGRRARSRRELNNLTLNDFSPSNGEKINPTSNRQTKSAYRPKSGIKHDQLSFPPELSISPAPSESSPQLISPADNQFSQDRAMTRPPRLSQSAHPASRQNSSNIANENNNSNDNNDTENESGETSAADENNPVRTLFDVIESIEERKLIQNSSRSRPKSAPAPTITHQTHSQSREITPGDEIYFDQETSNQVLSHLEQRLRDFHTSVIDRDRECPRVTTLRRYDLPQSSNTPVAGGTVLVKLKPCKYSNKMVENAEHSHTRRYILPKLYNYF